MTIAGTELTGLFEVHEPPRRRSVPIFALSTTLHGGAIALVSWALLHAPRISSQPVTQYKVRDLSFHIPENPPREALYPRTDPQAQTKPQMHPDSAPAGAGAKQETAQIPSQAHTVEPLHLLHLPEGGDARQTLLQPELQSHIALPEEIPLPTVLMWKPEPKAIRHIVPPAAQNIATADMPARVQIPNEELQLAQIPVAATATPSRVPAPPAANSSPVPFRSAASASAPPSTSAASSQSPAPAAILSVTDIRMKEGTAVLPPVNQLQGTQGKPGAAAANGNVLAARAAASAGAPEGGSSSNTAIADAKSVANSIASGESSQRIQLPKDGRFSVVVVGTSLADQYPETLQIWSDRTAYTAYLHVGTPKAWILQYAQLRSADAAASGAVTKLEAPWPYDILRPNLLNRDLNADALMVHGVLSETGRLQNLAIAYPPGYVHGSFVLHELAQWQFRPALQSGKAISVEVLLIIPEDLD